MNMVENAQERTVYKPDLCLDICCVLACTNSLKIGENYQMIVFYYFFYFIEMFIYNLINPFKFSFVCAHSLIPSISAFHSKKSSSSPIFSSLSIVETKLHCVVMLISCGARGHPSDPIHPSIPCRQYVSGDIVLPDQAH